MVKSAKVVNGKLIVKQEKEERWITVHGGKKVKISPRYHRPAIDHSMLSPSGKVSGRTRRAAQERAKEELFSQELFPEGLPGPSAPQPTKKESLLRQAARLRDLAERGMSPIKYKREAERLEQEAALEDDESLA